MAALTNVILGIQSLGDVSVIFDRLDKVAPDDIEPDVAAVKKSWDQMMDTMATRRRTPSTPAACWARW